MEQPCRWHPCTLVWDFEQPYACDGTYTGAAGRIQPPNLHRKQGQGCISMGVVGGVAPGKTRKGNLTCRQPLGPSDLDRVGLQSRGGGTSDGCADMRGYVLRLRLIAVSGKAVFLSGTGSPA